MKATAHLENPTASERSDTATRGGEARNTTWFVEEQPGFGAGLRHLAAGVNDGARTLALRPAGSLERSCTSRAADFLTARTPRRSRQDARAPRGGVLIPIVTLATLTILSYVAAVQSISAFRSAWHDTDTRVVGENARTQAHYQAEDGQIPGPFAWSPK